jgi:dipeptidase E
LCNESLREALRQMVGRPTGECNFVFIVTSYNGAAGDMTWLVNDIYNAHRMGWKNFRILDIAVKADWDKKLWWPWIEEADVILVGGGNSGYLSYWMQKAGLFEALPELLKTKVYIGISAGSMVMTAGMQTAMPSLKDESFELPTSDPNVPAGQTSTNTLDLTEFLFRPHWGKPEPKYDNLSEDLMRKAYAKLQKPIYLIDDQTGIKIEDNKPPEVISEGRWVLIDSDNQSA